MKNAIINVRVPQEVKNKLIEIAAADGMDLSKLMREIIMEFIKN